MSMPHYYDGSLNVSSFGFETNQSGLNIQVSIFDENQMEIYNIDMDFTADEYGMFTYADETMGLNDGEYMMEIHVTDVMTGNTLFEGTNMSLYVYTGGGADEVGMYVWTNGNYQSGDDVLVDFSAWGLEGDNYEMIWDCSNDGMMFIMERCSSRKYQR